MLNWIKAAWLKWEIAGYYRDREKITGHTDVDIRHRRVLDNEISNLEGKLRILSRRKVWKLF